MRQALGGLVALCALSCAKIEAPPGGPPDTSPPRLVATSPDSLAVLPGFDGEVEFRFSEVVSEGAAANLGTGTGDLERLVVLSPSTRVPEVRWRRSRITVRPREGWQPNRVYRVELLPGVSDLRNNRSTGEGAAAVVTFTTGAAVPVSTLRGTVYDWTTARPAAGALVEAVLLPDSLAYRFTADTGGRFTLAPLPAGTYLVFGTLDLDRDRERDPRESFDSLRVTTTAAAQIALWAFPRDTVGPRIREIQVRDSVSAQVLFTQPLDPNDVVDAASISLQRLPDSAAVAVVGLLREERTDTAAPRPAEGGPLRPALSDRLVLRAAAPWVPGTRYLLRVRGVKNANGVPADVTGTLIVPEAPRARPDTAAPPSR